MAEKSTSAASVQTAQLFSIECMQIKAQGRKGGEVVEVV